MRDFLDTILGVVSYWVGLLIVATLILLITYYWLLLIVYLIKNL